MSKVFVVKEAFWAGVHGIYLDIDKALKHCGDFYENDTMAHIEVFDTEDGVQIEDPKIDKTLKEYLKKRGEY